MGNWVFELGWDIKIVSSVNASAGVEVFINSGPAKNPSLWLVILEIESTLDNILLRDPRRCNHLTRLLIPADPLHLVL